jgi:CheY-like chemotaxis protein
MHELLVVEDDLNTLEALAELLQEDGREIVTARNGKEALDCVKRMPRFSLILLDLSMPEMDGWEFLRQVRIDPSIPRIPTIVVSGSVSKVPEGAMDLLGKPVDLGRLRALVSQYC